MSNFVFTTKTNSAVVQVDDGNQIVISKHYVPLVIMPDNKVLQINASSELTMKNSSKLFMLIPSINVDDDNIEIDGEVFTGTTAQQLYNAVESLFFLDDGSGSHAIDGDIYLNNLFEVEKDTEGNIIKTRSIYDFQVPPESIEVGEAIKVSDLGQSLSYTTKFDGKQYLLMGYEINNTGSGRPFVKELQEPSSFEIQPLSDEQETFTTQQSFPILSFQDVIGKTYNLKAYTASETFRIRLIRRATNGGEDTLIVDETIPGTQTNINGFDFDLSPITDFTTNTDYNLILSVEDGDNFDLLGSSVPTGSFLPYIKRQFGWEYTKKDIAYLEDAQGFISSSEKGQPNGVAPLNNQGKIDAQYIDVDVEGGIDIIGYWDADTNTPDLSSLTLDKGQAYQVSVAGDTTLNGYTTWNEFDLAIWGDNITGNWFRIVSTEKVLSVNGKKGEVVITKGDLNLENVDNTADIDKGLSIAAVTEFATKVDVGGDITDLNNDAGYINTVLVDGTTVTGDGVNTPLSSIGGGGGDAESHLLKTNILNGVAITSNTSGQYDALDCIGSLDFSEGTGWVVEADGITVPQDGVYEVSLGIHFSSNGQRSTPVVSLSVDGVLVGDESNNAYIRNTSSINSDSCVLTTSLQLLEGQKIGVQARREGARADTARTLSQGSFFSVKKLSKSALNEGVSSLNDLTDVTLNEAPRLNQILRFNGNVFSASDESGGGGSVEVINKEVDIVQGSWSANVNYIYANIPVEGVTVGQLCIIDPSHLMWQTIQANNATWDGFAYCSSPGLVTAVCRVSSFIGISPLSTFNIKVIESVVNLGNLFIQPERPEIEVLSNNTSISHEDHDKQFNIKSPLDYNIVLPSLEDVSHIAIYKFKNFHDSTVKGSFIPLSGELIEGNSSFELFGRGTLSLRKKTSGSGDSWSVVEISNLFDHVGQGKSKEVSFENNSGTLEIVHNRGYRPMVKVYLEDGFGDYSDVDVDIDHNSNLNSFIVNLEGVTSGLVRYI